MSDIPEAILSRAREIYEGSWPDPVRAIAEALMEASQQWQPIETAPKDGTRMLLRLSNGEVFSGWGTEHAGFQRFHADGTDIGWLNPRHWMPLPSPPEGPVDITDIAQAAHPIIDAGNALIQHLKGKSA
jgi:hypothetical protein